jgi:hypothetical protein
MDVNLPDEVTPEIETARNMLADEFDNRIADQEAIKTTINLSLSPERRQQLLQLQTVLATETQDLYRSGLLCFSDLANCPSKAKEVLANLIAYDPNMVNPNPKDGLVAYYPFNGGALDETGNGHNGTVHGASLIADRRGNSNSAYGFDGRSNYISVPHSTSLNPNEFTVTAWIYRKQNCAECMIFNKEDSYELAIRGGNKLQFGMWPAPRIMRRGILEQITQKYMNTHADSGWIDTGMVIPEMQWVHVAMKYGSGNVTVYMNAFPSEALRNGLDKSNYPFLIGQRSKYVSTPFAGAIDDIRIYNRALADSEIKQLHTSDPQNNAPPAAIFVTSQGSASNNVVNVDASKSSDPDGIIKSYRWLVSNQQVASGINSNITINSPGQHVITLIITDDKGATSEARKTISIGNTSIANPTQPTNPISNPTTGKLSGISTRCLVGARAEDYMYAGFNISGGTKKVTVGAYTVTQIPGNNFLPRLEIKTFPEGKSVYVDNNQNLVHSVANTLDLAEGWYTVTVSPIAQAGIGIVYVNEVDANSALLSSISTRCYVGTKEEDSMIAGISVAGNSQCVEMLGLGITQIPGNTFLPMLNVQTFPDNKHFNAAKSIYADVNTKHEARISKLQQLEVGPYTSMVTPVQAAGIGQVAVSTKTTCN